MFIQNSAIQILKKHIEHRPKLTIVVSVFDDSTLNVDLSAPGTLGEILFMQKMLEREINKLLETSLQGKSLG